MLTDNAQNLMSAVSEVLYATEAATIRVPPDARKELGLQWVKRAWRVKYVPVAVHLEMTAHMHLADVIAITLSCIYSASRVHALNYCI